MKSAVKLGVMFAMITFSIFGYAEAWGVDWKYYGTNEEGSYFYETETMTRLSAKYCQGVCSIDLYGERRISLGERGWKRISKFGL